MMNILIGDDHGLIRTGIKLMCKDVPCANIVAEVDRGEAVLKALREHKEIDLVILDINMPGMSGFDCAEAIKEEELPCKILFLSMYEEEEYILKALELGAVGYVSKGYADQELADALIVIAEGGSYISPRLSHHVIKQVVSTKKSVEEDALSSRELEVLSFICAGYGLTEIGEKLNLSVKTIDTYKSRIMAKTKCEKKHELIAYAKKRGLV